MTKINIISGFLGAGKTTLIKKLLKEAFSGEKLVLIENEFGEIGVDGGFLQDAGIEITEMNSGCICCSLVGDFKASLEMVINKYQPDRILIEPSGVGKLSDVKKAVQSVDNIEIESSITVVDAKKYKMYQRNFAEFFNDQVENAACIILSRTQDIDNSTLEELHHMIKKQNPQATIITTPWLALDSKIILKAMNKVDIETSLDISVDKCECGHHHHHEHGEECECGHHHHHEHGEECECGHHHHHADEVFTSWGVETPHAYKRENLDKILNSLSSDDYGTILRAKGIVASDNGWLFFDMVPNEVEIREGMADYTGKICVIGSNLNTSALEVLFELKRD